MPTDSFDSNVATANTNGGYIQCYLCFQQCARNVRDALRPMGNFDLLEEGLILSYGAHMDTVEEFDAILRMSTYNAAKALRLPNYGLEPGCTADFVILDAPTPSAAIVGQVEKAVVVKNGRFVAANQTINQLFNTRDFTDRTVDYG